MAAVFPIAVVGEPGIKTIFFIYMSLALQGLPEYGEGLLSVKISKHRKISSEAEFYLGMQSTYKNKRKNKNEFAFCFHRKSYGTMLSKYFFTNNKAIRQKRMASVIESPCYFTIFNSLIRFVAPPSLSIHQST